MEQTQNVVEYEKIKTSKLAIAALILGIGSISLAIGLGGFYLGIPGIIVSILAFINIDRKFLEGKKIAKAGMITSVIGLIGSILVIVLFSFGMQSIQNSISKKFDVQIAEAMASATKWLYVGPYEEELPDIIGTKIIIAEGAVVPECVEESVATIWSDGQFHNPTYTGNGAYAYVIELGETECKAIYITNGVEEWEVWPSVDEEYR